MRAKPILLLVVALGCGMVAAVAASKAVMNQGNGSEAEATVEIFVAVKDLQHAQKLSAENVRLDKWPRSRLPEGALVKLEQLEGKFTNQGIFAGEPILERKLSDSRDSFSTGIPEGYRIFDIAGGTSGYIKPGDRVDITGTFQLGNSRAARESRTVMRNVKVHGINGITVRDSDQLGNAKNMTFQLLVKETQLEALTLANTLGSLRLNLRPLAEEETEDDPDNGESFLNWVNAADAAPEPTLLTSTTLMPQEPAKPQQTGPFHELSIITPNGIQRFQFDDDKSLPRRLDDSGSAGLPPGTGVNGATGSSSGNVSSGYGGYPPTYPIGATEVPTSQGELSFPGEDEPNVIQRIR